MISRLVRSVDFERVLRTRTRAHSLHFAVHHLTDRPSTCAKAVSKVADSKLSTGGVPSTSVPVDDPCEGSERSEGAASKPHGLGDFAGPDGQWLGIVVPKRHARRAVTRTLLKRQIRRAVGDHAEALARGLWVVRLRAPFDRQHFVSAASTVLRRAARAELDQLLNRAAQVAQPAQTANLAGAR